MSACGRGQTANLDAIRAISTQVSAAAPAFQAVSSDLYQSCLRLRETNGATRLGGLSGDGTLQFDQPPIEPSPAAPPSDAPPPTTAGGSLAVPASPPGTALGTDPNCTIRRWDSQRWSLVNAFLTDYAGALAKLAGANTSVSGFDKTATALKTAGALRSDAFAALAGNAVNAIGSSLLVHERDRDLLAVVAAADRAGIDTAIFEELKRDDRLYYAIVSAEFNAENAYYGAMLTRESELLARLRKRAGLPADPDFPGTRAGPGGGPVLQLPDPDLCRPTRALAACEAQVEIGLLRERIRVQRAGWQQADDDFQNRFAAAASYYSAIRSVQESHRLVAKTTSADLQGVLAQLQPYLAELSTNLSALQASTSAPAKSDAGAQTAGRPKK